MREIASILDLKRQQGRVDTLRRELIALGAKWRETISSAPVDFPVSTVRLAPSKRIRWLENKVDKPAKQLLKNLGDDKAPYFSTWGSFEPLDDVDRSSARETLSTLVFQLDALILDLHRQQNEGAPQTGEMRYDIVWDLVQFFKQHCPDLQATRGTYDPESKRWIGHLPAFVDVAFSEITGGDVMPGKKLDNLITLALKD
ncbi:hypothetical protein [Ruegeria sp. HKCCD7318]|uniref:hypothetical protein n=1 Tax=Ruegeria sp. HKCCD7318 TaxID=2683014 RepID=UPI0014929D85|nr:hypothetical protein [Ruegeria sp. HKCCD7318]NOE32175.1 hypothetical protein [Ruegeria sp. HKCCD7318]